MPDPGALVLHGFTGTPGSVSGVADALAGAGFVVEAPHQAGHGAAKVDIVAPRVGDREAGVEQSYTDLAGRCRQVIVFGLSLGGSLACWLAAEHPEIAGIVCVNPMIEPVAPSFVEMLEQLVASGFSSIPAFGSDIARPDVVEENLGGAPFVPMMSLFEGVGELAGRLGRIRCPLLLFTSRKDHVVPPSSSDYLAARVAGPVERVLLERSYHVATLDWEAPDIEARTVEFAKQVTAAPAV